VPNRFRLLDDANRRNSLADYLPLPGVPDEVLDEAGRVRPVWSRFIDFFGRIPAEDIPRRFARGDQYLRDAGVFYRHYNETGSTEREWPLSHVPVLISALEWAEITAGLIQRADVLERVAADLYGPNRLIATGQLPAALIAQSPEWLRPLVGVMPRGGHFLNFLAFEIGRGPNGQWWVLGDRTQAPSGAGFALENRVATARIFPDFYPEANIHRLAGFFRDFRDALLALSADGKSQVGILTPGPLNDTYFEHAYIARYLGFMLLEGEDLAVENGHVMVRTVEGLKPVSVLWRRLDAAYADPLELNEASSIGTAGLVGAARAGTISLVNALGAGVLETRALFAFMPRLSESLLGEPLKLPNVATWWCGQEQERDTVIKNAARIVIGPALATQLPFDHAGLGDHGFLAGRGADEALAAYIERAGPSLVGQEAVTLSTTPAFIEGRLQPRPMSIRVFLARTPQGWQVMPGGYARIGRSRDATAIAMQRGGSVADVWVVSDAPVEQATLLPSAQTPYQRPEQGILPSRAADNLYWMGRYVERAEGVMRLLRAYHARFAEHGGQDTPLLALIREDLEAMGIDDLDGVPAGLQANLTSAITSASKVRDRFSIDGWMALNDLSKSAARINHTVQPGDDNARAMGILLRKITGFSGLVHENMYRFMGWRFLSIGRSLERAARMAGTLARLTAPDAPEGALDLAVELGDSPMTHRRRYTVSTNRDTVIDLLALDAMNPRAMLYHLGELHEHARFLPEGPKAGAMAPFARATLKLQTELAIALPHAITPKELLALQGEIYELSPLLTELYFV